MSVFTEAEIEYLRGQMHGHLATVGRDSQPHVVPVTFWLNLDEDTIDIGGINFGATKKWRNAQYNPRVTFLVDDSPEPGRAGRSRCGARPSCSPPEATGSTRGSRTSPTSASASARRGS